MSDKIYGIDLGTTNSLIGCDNKLITRLVSSKVDFKQRCIVPHYRVGEGIVGSYKVDMGLGEDGYMPIDASSIVLQALVDAVKKETGDIVENVIISVPAYFSSNQRLAVSMAAKKVGLNLVNVINEPTAAAIQICSKEGKGTLRRGIYVVYDLGGGTFDCTIIDSRSGKYHVIGTDGCILGGDNLNRNICEEVLRRLKVPFYKRTKQSMSELIESCKNYKIYMQEQYDAFNLDATYKINLPIEMGDDCCVMNMEDYHKLVRDTFGKTITIMDNLISSKVPKGVPYKVVFVGGSTHCAYLTNHVCTSLSLPYSNVEFDESPDYTVAFGVVKYATSIQNGEEDVEFKDVTKQLSIEDNEGKAVVIIPANTNIPCTKTKIVVNTDDTDTLRVKLYQGNSVIAANNEYLGYLEYKYSSFMRAGEGDVEVTVSIDVGGFITLEVEDIYNFGGKQVTHLKGF